MKRRKFILGTGAAAASGASLLGSGAFTSVSAERSIAVDVVGDADAFLRLGPCTIDGDQQPNGAYVQGHVDGTMSIDLSDSNDQVIGSGVNADALSRFHNVFEVCNQGTQSVCVDFAVDAPVIPNGTDVPDRYDFEDGDLAVVFYRGDDPSDKINVDALEADRPGATPLAVGDCQCLGFEVRAFGFDTDEDLFEDANLKIIAEAGTDCVGEPDEPVNNELVEKTWADSVVDDDNLGTKKNGDPIDDGRDDAEDSTGEDDGDFVSLGWNGAENGEGGSLVVGFDEDDQLVKRGFGTDSCLVETTGGRDNYPEETALVEVRNADTEVWYEVGEATNKASGGTNTFELPTEPVDQVRITNTTDPSDHGGDADGFDVAAVGGYTQT